MLKAFGYSSPHRWHSWRHGQCPSSRWEHSCIRRTRCPERSHSSAWSLEPACSPYGFCLAFLSWRPSTHREIGRITRHDRMAAPRHVRVVRDAVRGTADQPHAHASEWHLQLCREAASTRHERTSVSRSIWARATPPRCPRSGPRCGKCVARRPAATICHQPPPTRLRRGRPTVPTMTVNGR